MSEVHPELEELKEAFTEDVSDLSFARGSLVRELQKSAFRGDHEITLILARAYCEKIRRELYVSQPCIIYCRVSTEQQGYGTGLARQLKTCSDYARQKDYTIDSIFSEVASGVSDLPIRALVERLAVKKQCLILCEDHSRWSRKGTSDMPPKWVIMTSSMYESLEHELKTIVESRQSQIGG